MNVRRQFLLSLLAASLFPQWGGAQELPTDVRQEIGKFLDTTARKEVSVGRISIDSVAVEGNTLQLFANMNCAYIPFREDNVAEIYQGVSALLPAEFTKYKLQIRTNKRSIEELVPQVLRSKKDKKTKTFNPVASKPLVTDISAPYTPTNGLQNRHIALWHSHGGIFPMATPRLVLRAETRPLGMAACTYLPDRGRPLHPKLRIAFPRADAGKCRCQRAASPRTRLPDGRSHRRQ